MIRTRIAPSPTGKDIHVGTIATALINYAWAKKNHGQFIVRIEDTDRTRLVIGAEQKMLDTLNKIGLVPDESPEIKGPYGPYRQSERLALYKKYAEELIQKGAAYYCICTKERLDEMRKKQLGEKKIPKYDRHCLNNQEEVIKKIKQGFGYVIRLKIPEKLISLNDVIRGKITFDGKNLDDQVLLKSDGFPTYHLAVVIDDHLMKISHVIRAEEWLPSTPKHIVLYEAFGWQLPVYAHVTLLRNADKSKLSKRKNPVWASSYIEQGILPEALLNYLSIMGWSHPEEKEIFTLAEYVSVFNLKDIQKTAPIFDPLKLDWMNGEYLRKLNLTELETRILEYYQQTKNMNLNREIVRKTVPLVQTRMKKLSEYWSLVKFIFEKPEKIEFPLDTLRVAKAKLLTEYKELTWQHAKIYQKTEDVAKELNLKPIKLYMDIRYALSNQKVTVPLFEGMEIIGQAETIHRLEEILK